MEREEARRGTRMQQGGKGRGGGGETKVRADGRQAEVKPLAV